MGITEAFAWFVCNICFEKLPEAAIEKAKLATLDTVGVILAAVQDPIGKIIGRYVRERGGSPEAGVIGWGFQTSAEMAALANGTMAHALDYDDTGLSMGHPSICIVPTVLALGELLNCSGRKIAEALIAGYEIEGKLGFGAVYDQVQKGIHGSALFGTLGAAAAAAKLLGLDLDRTRTAFGVAASQVAGLVRNAGSMTKPLHAGNACRAGVMAALLARDGFTADAEIIEAPRGYGDTFFGKDNYDEAKMVGCLGNPLHIVSPGITAKKYPCCMLNHRALDAVLGLLQNYDITHEQVDRVVVGVPRDIFPLRIDAHTGFQGKFCLPYNLAAALVDGNITLESFTDDMVQRPFLRSVMARVRLQVREDVPIYTGSTASGRAGNPVELHLKDGRILKNQVDIPKGSPELPLTTGEYLAKYHDCAKGVLSRDREKRSADMILNLEKLGGINELMEILTL